MKLDIQFSPAIHHGEIYDFASQHSYLYCKKHRKFSPSWNIYQI